MSRRVSGRGWAYVGASLGGAVSIAANVAHSYVPPAVAAANWVPHTGAVVGAIFWPVSLFVAVEILARVAWPTGRGWTALRFGGLLPVAAVAAMVSYRHLSGLLVFYGEDSLTATLGPLAVDGLMVMATGALLATGRRAPVEPVAETPAVPVTVTAKPVAEPVAVMATKPATERSRPRSLTAEQRVAKAHSREPGATHARIADLARVSATTVKKYRPVSGQPSGDSPAETPRITGHVPELTGAAL